MAFRFLVASCVCITLSLMVFLWVARSGSVRAQSQVQRWSATQERVAGLFVFELRDDKTDSCYVVVYSNSAGALAMSPAHPCPE